MKAKKLIEVAMPIKEISAESVRDKSIRHGHISTLHLWWARRPLPACRAVVFASLVPDPLDPNCPQAFKDAVSELLIIGMEGAKYAPYIDIPYTAAADIMPDNLRNRLLMFIGKFSPECQANMIKGVSTPPARQLQDGCLVKWESRNDETVLQIARKLIWVAYHADKDASYKKLSQEFDTAYYAIKQAEEKLYSIPNRNTQTKEVLDAENNLKQAIESFQNQMPSVFDPFAGGGAIPLEAARLGCRSYGNDINPVAHIIEKGSVEFPQKYGKQIIYTYKEFEKLYGKEGVELLKERGIEWEEESIVIPNRLSFDVEYYAKKLIAETGAEVGHLYPDDALGNKLIAYYWARTAKCSNPSCGAEVPLLKGFQLANSSVNSVYLQPLILGKNIDFSFEEGISTAKQGWNNRGTLTCPCCGAVTGVAEVKKQSNENRLTPRLIGGIYATKSGKVYKTIPEKLRKFIESPVDVTFRPTEKMQRNSNGGDTHPWGFTKWADLYSDRQLCTLNTFVRNLQKIELNGDEDYRKAVKTYLGIWFDRLALINTSFGRYDTKRENIQHPYNRQAIAMIFDYPEGNPFSGASGSAENQLEWVVRYIESKGLSPFSAHFNNASSGEKEQFALKSLTSVVTDPPYYDAIAYADISDLFYLWLKQTIGSEYPINFSTPQTPKTEECTAIKHHHNNDYEEAKLHFEHKLQAIFTAIGEQTSDVVSIMFAHQSTEAWTTLCNSILGANMNIEGSWALDTEMANRAVGLSGDALESSVTVACRPSEKNGYGSYKKIKSAIQEKVAEEVRSLYALGFRGADLLTACFGKAVSVFGNYEKVEKSDGSEVTVAELLDMARTAAFTALIRDFDGDEYTKFYIGWLQLNGMGSTDYDDATKFTRVGVNVNIGDIQSHKLLIKDEDGKRQHLASYSERAKDMAGIPSENSPIIDKVHQAMCYWKEELSHDLSRLIQAYGMDINNAFWRVVVVLKELLPEGDDRAQVLGLLSNADNLIKTAKTRKESQPKQANLFDNAE